MFDNVILLLGPRLLENRCKGSNPSPNMRLHAQRVQWKHDVEAMLNCLAVELLEPCKCILNSTS